MRDFEGAARRRQEREAARASNMQHIVNLKAQGLSYQAIADAFDNRWSRQRIEQLHKQALAEGMTPIDVSAGA